MTSPTPVMDYGMVAFSVTLTSGGQTFFARGMFDPKRLSFDDLVNRLQAGLAPPSESFDITFDDAGVTAEGTLTIELK